MKIVAFVSLVFLTAFVPSSDPVISGELRFLAGRYELLHTSPAGTDNKTYAADIADKYEIRITSNDEFICYKNGKKVRKFDVWPGEIPFLDSMKYIAVRQKREISPVFFSKDKIQFHLFPFEFNDNVFLRVEAEE